MLISLVDVKQVLDGCFGPELVSATTLAADCAGLLRCWMPGVGTVDALRTQLEECLFSGFYASLGPSLVFHPAKGQPIRVVLDALPEAADRLLLIPFLQLSVTAGNYALLKEYAMRSGSTAAICALYRRFSAFQSEEERRVQARILRENQYFAGGADAPL